MKTLNRFRVKGWVLFFLVGVSAVAVYSVLARKQTTSLVSCGTYLLSAYTLCCLVFYFIEQYKILTARALQISFVHRYFQDFEWRTILNTYVSLAINFAFAAIKMFFSIRLSSFWFAAIAVYYIVMSIARCIILWNDRRIRSLDGQKEIRLRQLRTYRASGYLLFVLTAALLGAVWQMVFSARSSMYPGHLIYAVAFFAFYSVITAVLNLLKVKALDNPIVSAAKIISFASALVSMLTLQTAMFASFGGTDSKALSQIMNAIFGTFVCFGVLAMAVIAVVVVQKEIRILKKT